MEIKLTLRAETELNETIEVTDNHTDLNKVMHDLIQTYSEKVAAFLPFDSAPGNYIFLIGSLFNCWRNALERDIIRGSEMNCIGHHSTGFFEVSMGAYVPGKYIRLDVTMRGIAGFIYTNRMPASLRPHVVQHQEYHSIVMRDVADCIMHEFFESYKLQREKAESVRKSFNQQEGN